MPLIGRSIVILLAFILASGAAGIAIAVALLGPDWPALSGTSAERAGFWTLAFFAAALTGAVTILPMFILVVLAEAFALRSVLLYAVAGATILVVGYFASGFADRLEAQAAQLPLVQEALIAAAGGIVFGFVFWLLAGRRAGRWRARRP